MQYNFTKQPTILWTINNKYQTNNEKEYYYKKKMRFNLLLTLRGKREIQCLLLDSIYRSNGYRKSTQHKI